MALKRKLNKKSWLPNHVAGKINLYKKETLGFAIITRKVGRKTTKCVSPTGMHS